MCCANSTTMQAIESINLSRGLGTFYYVRTYGVTHTHFLGGRTY